MERLKKSYSEKIEQIYRKVEEQTLLRKDINELSFSKNKHINAWVNMVSHEHQKSDKIDGEEIRKLKDELII